MLDNKFKNLAKEMAKYIKEDKPKTSSYDTQAVVRRIEGDTAYVHIPGGIDETPVSKTIAAQKGDTVQVRVSGKKAFLVGNASAPPTDDKVANVAKTEAAHATTVAEDARISADNAEAEALRAKDAANEAYEAAGNAQVSADTADKAAQSAKDSANSALFDLSQIEQVVGILNWITEHGSYSHTKEAFSTEKIYYQVENAAYAASSDTEVDQDKDYYTLSGGVYAWVAEPTGNPSTSGYYEMTSGDFEQVVGTLVTYALTTDTEIDESKTYYVSDGSGGYNVVTEPVQADIGSYYEAVVYNLPRAEDINTYYELKIDEAISNYVASHLSLSSSGLWLQMDGTNAKLQLSPTDGLVLYGTDGTPVATYGEGIMLGDRQGFHITIDPTNGIIFWQNETRVAYINSNILEIPKSLMLESIQIGNNKWEWKKQADDNLTLIWIGGTANGNS